MADNGSRPKPEEIILYEKDPKTKIATITFNRPEYLNAPTSAARLRYADLLRAATVDDDVKVVVIRGVGDDLGSGADLPEFMEGNDNPTCGWPSCGWRTTASARSAIRRKGSFRHGATISAVVRQRAGGQPAAAGAQEDQHRRGQGLLLRLAFLPVRRCRPRDLLRRRAVRPPVVPLLRLGPADVDLGADDGAAQVPGDGVHRTAVHRRGDARSATSSTRWSSRDELEAEVEKYALACARNRPVDTVFQQKMFFEVVKQYQGEYMGSLLSALFESMGSARRHDDTDDFDVDEAIDSGLADAVNDNDSKFPPDFRLSKSNRKKEGLADGRPARRVHRHRSVRRDRRRLLHQAARRRRRRGDQSRSRQKGIRCGGGRRPEPRSRPATTARCSASWRARSTASSSIPRCR